MAYTQAPRPLKQSDLEKVLATSKKTKVAAHEYMRLMQQSSSWPVQREGGEDYPVHSAINELSKLVVSQILSMQTDNQLEE